MKNTDTIKEIFKGAGLAPMAGATDSPFRRCCLENDAGWVVSEMVSAKALTLKDKKTSLLLYRDKSETPYGVQIFGSQPLIMAKAAEIVQNAVCPEFIDINMGCPTPKIVSGGAGSALMKNPKLAADITREVIKAVSVPVTVKIRAGYDQKNAVDVAKHLEQAGASVIAVHGRTRDQMYRPPVDIDIIGEVKKAVSVRVIGNGDIYSANDAQNMLEKTGCDALLVGRGCLGNPFLFNEINSALGLCELKPHKNLEQKLAELLVQIERLVELKGEYIALREARKHAAWYIKGMRGAAALRNMTTSLCSLEDLKSFIKLALETIGQ